MDVKFSWNSKSLHCVWKIWQRGKGERGESRICLSLRECHLEASNRWWVIKGQNKCMVDNGRVCKASCQKVTQKKVQWEVYPEGSQIF